MTIIATSPAVPPKSAGQSLTRAIVLAAALALALSILPRGVVAKEARSGDATATDYLPDAALVDQAGHPVSLASLKGKPVLVGFIHTSCGGVCEMLTAKMKSVAQDLDPLFDTKVTMVSVTTDPKEDSPAQLATYAKSQGAVGDGWIFLTGQPAEVARVLKVYNVPAGDPGDELTHVLDLFLIGPDGRELRRYQGMQVKATEVAADIRNAVAHR